MLVDIWQLSFWFSLISIIFNPIFWNFVAQNEYRNKTITKLLKGNATLGVKILAGVIFILGTYRDILYKRALVQQPTWSFLEYELIKAISVIFIVSGTILVVSSIRALGLHGTYLGDYFGILMGERVTEFPFNITENPMYYGSTVIFLGYALLCASPAGLILTAVVFACYKVALMFEGPFTEMIYNEAAKSQDDKQE